MSLFVRNIFPKQAKIFGNIEQYSKNYNQRSGMSLNMSFLFFDNISTKEQLNRDSKLHFYCFFFLKGLCKLIYYPSKYLLYNLKMHIHK